MAMSFLNGAGHWVGVFGLLALLLGERILADGDGLRWWATGLGVGLLAVVFAARVLRWLGADRAPRRALRPAVMGYGATLVGIGVYGATSPAAFEFLSLDGPFARAWDVGGAVLWPLLVAGGSAAAVLADAARVAGGDARVAPRRPVQAAIGALTVVLAVGWVAGFNYIAHRTGVHWNWNAATRVVPSEATRDVVASLPAEVRVTAFFSPGNDVFDRLAPYLQALASLSDRFVVEVLDHAIEPKRAKALGATANGLVFITRGERKEQIHVGDEYVKARDRLRDFDSAMLQALLRLVRGGDAVFLTTGHGERNEGGEGGRARIRQLRRVLRDYIVETRSLGPKDGLGGQLGSEVARVAIVGPQTAFLPEETDSLRRWYAQGGGLLLLLDPGVDHGLGPLLEDLGVEVREGVVAHGQHHRRASGGPADRGHVYTNRLVSHPVTRTVVAVPDRYLRFEDAGLLRRVQGVAKTVTLVQPMLGAFLDADGDRKRDPEAPNIDAAPMILASTTTVGDAESRAIIIADSSFAADDGLTRPNLQLLFDALRWLARDDDARLRVQAPRIDPPMEHTRDRDAAWFWSTVVGIPTSVFLFGLGRVRRRRRRGGS